MIDPFNYSHLRENNAFQSFNNKMTLDMQKTKEEIQKNIELDAQQGIEISGNTYLNAEQSAAIIEMQSDIEELKSGSGETADVIEELKDAVNEKADVSAVTEVKDALDSKADASVVSDLEEVVNSKADTSAVTEVKDALAEKADASAVSDLEEVVNSKANASAITEVKDALDGKADVSVVSDLEEVVNGKADTSAVTEVKDSVDDIYDTIDDIEASVDEKAEKVAVTESNTEIASLLARLSSLESKVSELSKNNVVIVSDNEEIVKGINEPTKYVELTGEIKPAVETTSATPVSIKAKSLEIGDATVTDNTRLSIAAEKVMISDSVIDGEFPRKNGGNAIMSMNEASDVIIRNVTVANSGETNYNAFEIGLNSANLPKSVLIDGCNFTGKLTNNGILVFGTQDDAVITISNCHFEDISNGLRLSNKTNATGVTVNIVNCTVDKWESTPEYAGFVLCQDYTSATIEETKENNLFGNGKITVNFTNLVYNGEKVTKDYTGQLLYVYGGKTGVLTDDEYRPIVNVF